MRPVPHAMTQELKPRPHLYANCVVMGRSADCGRDAHEHVRQANHRNNGGGYFGDHEGFLAFHRERRVAAVAQFFNQGMAQETAQVKMRVLEAARCVYVCANVHADAVHGTWVHACPVRTCAWCGIEGPRGP